MITIGTKHNPMFIESGNVEKHYDILAKLLQGEMERVSLFQVMESQRRQFYIRRKSRARFPIKL